MNYKNLLQALLNDYKATELSPNQNYPYAF